MERLTSDKHGNLIAQEGCTRCACGCKYWENDRCIDCGESVPVPVQPKWADLDFPNLGVWEQFDLNSGLTRDVAKCICCGTVYEPHVEDGGNFEPCYSCMNPDYHESMVSDWAADRNWQDSTWPNEY